MYHLYEAIFESPRMWLKIQASCRSQDQASAFLGARFGKEVRSANLLEYKLAAPFRLSERSQWIANWDLIRDHLTEGWDDHEFRLVQGPYPWCETLSDDCDCHGTEGRLDAAYCSDVGLVEDVNRRAVKSMNVRHFRWRQEMGRDDANVEDYDEERLQSYWNAVLNMVKAAQDLKGAKDSDCLYLVVKVDRRNPRGEGTLTKVQRDLTDPTGYSHRITISRYPNWDICLGIMDGLTDGETA